MNAIWPKLNQRNELFLIGFEKVFNNIRRETNDTEAHNFAVDTLKNLTKEFKEGKITEEDYKTLKFYLKNDFISPKDWR